MTFEEFEKATASKLREEAKLCFDNGQQNPSWGGAPTHLLQAQFYLAEIDRRQAEIDRRQFEWISRRDFWMDVIIIFLIIGELIFGYFTLQEGKEQTLVLAALQQSASATAKTLTALQATTEQMYQAIVSQLELTSRVALDVNYDGAMLNITNTAPANVALYGWRLGESVPVMDVEPRILAAGSFNQIGIGAASQEINKLYSSHARAAVPLELYLKANDGTEYIAKGSLVGDRDKRTGVVRMTAERLVITKSPWRHKQK